MYTQLQKSSKTIKNINNKEDEYYDEYDNDDKYDDNDDDDDDESYIYDEDDEDEYDVDIHSININKTLDEINEKIMEAIDYIDKYNIKFPLIELKILDVNIEYHYTKKKITKIDYLYLDNLIRLDYDNIVNEEKYI
jgi:hypothetical protein